MHRSALIAAAVLLLAACGGSEPEPAETPPSADPAPVEAPSGVVGTVRTEADRIEADLEDRAADVEAAGRDSAP